MDMQGTPIGSTNKGMKNTTDPAAKQEIREGAGPVASDSLAAESTRSGGGFGDNRDSEPSAVKGSNSTFANEDTSAATTLPPAKDAAERASQTDDTPSSDKGPGGVKYAEALDGQPDFPGATTASGYSGGPSGASTTKGPSGGVSDATKTEGSSGTSSGADTGENPSGGGVDASQVDTEASSADIAPTYVNSQTTANTGHVGRPKGKNLTEGGFDSDDTKNASFTEDVDSKDDPGRLATQQFDNTQAATEGDGPGQAELSGEGQYDTLATDE